RQPAHRASPAMAGRPRFRRDGHRSRRAGYAGGGSEGPGCTLRMMPGRDGRRGTSRADVDDGEWAYWAHAPGDVAEALRVSPAAGLSSEEVAERLARHGFNELVTGPVRTAWQVLAGQFRGVLTWMLVAAAVLSAAFGQWSEAVAVLVVLVINGAAGFLTELRAVRSVEALRRLGTSRASVRRDGVTSSVEARRLVPVDVMLS